MEQLRSLKHELRHHVETLNALCQAREWERLGAYLTQLGAAGNALPSLYYTEHFLVNAILAGKLGPGIVVACQTERSQFQNKETCMKMLRSKLVEIKEREHLEKISDIKGDQKKIEWGSQIRSYVFMPYTLAKDTRTRPE